MFDKEDYYFRVRYRKLNTHCKLSNALRSDLKFESDAGNRYVFALYPEFETLSEENIVGGEREALDEGTAIIRKPIYEDKGGYFDMIRERVKIGKRAYLVGGSHKVAELEIVEIINEL
ncbi:hypothetical protein MJO52_15405 [Microbulbifer variabilis]|uniref:Uncharacterized protein n=1 Tax=Microbulbifer variabilis TaxID=266805 RepID=A0ABY4VAN2_9GAMM|nr:hypothetical protein [Microbulbifer variabilis]USD20451.1 hypothetical protein MJO52_15405 [Microbulbifer variabilis]